MGDLGPLEIEAGLLGGAGRGPRALMPAEGAPLGHEHTAPGEGPEPELDVLGPPLGESLVETAHQIVEPPGDAEVAAGHHPEQVLRPSGEVGGAGHVEIDPLGALNGAALEQVGQGPGPGPHGGGVQINLGHMGPEADRHHVGGGVVPAGVGSQPIGLGHHVAVEESQDLAFGGPGPGVAGPGQAEAAVGLMHHPHGQRAVGDGGQGRVRAVVHHHHLEQMARVGLALQRSQGEGQGLGGLVVGHHHGGRAPGRELVGRVHGQSGPVVAPNPGGRRLGGRRLGHPGLGGLGFGHPGLGHPGVVSSRARAGISR